MTMKWDFWTGPDENDRRIKYAKFFKPEYQANGDEIQRRIAAVIVAFKSDTQVELPGGYSSGWRPPGLNELTANAGKLSAHLSAEAGDVRDTHDGALAWWCMRNPGVLEQHGLYMEHPVATVVRAFQRAKEQKRDATPWCHLTMRAPASHLRCYWPDGQAQAEWIAFQSAGGHPGFTYDAWIAIATKAKPNKSNDLA